MDCNEEIAHPSKNSKSTKSQNAKNTTTVWSVKPPGPAFTANKKLRAENAVVATSNEDGFQVVSARKAAKKSDTIVTAQIPVSNKFNTLQESIDIDEAETSAPQIQTKVIKPEAIFLKMNDQWRAHVAAINELLLEEVTKKISGELVKLIPKDIEQYRSIQKYLTSNNCEFFGMRPKPERPRKILIKGIPSDTPIEEVKEELLKLNYSVNRISILKNHKTQKFLPIYLCNMYLNDNFKNIFELRQFLGFMVTVVPYVYKGIKQCYNCQKYNHSSETCSMKPVCVKCGGEHSARNCDAPMDSVRCGNCGDSHTANYRGCPRNPRNILAEKQKIRTIRSSTVQEGVTFSSLLSNSHPPKTQVKAAAPNTAPKNPQLLSDAMFPPLPSTAATSSNNTANLLNNFSNCNISALDSVIAKLDRIIEQLQTIHKETQKLNLPPSLIFQLFTGSTAALPSAQP